MEDRYWKKVTGDRTSAVYRCIKGKFESYELDNGWHLSDQYERAVQDPEFPDITKKEADTLIGQLILKKKLGEDSSSWPKHCLIEYPTKFEVQIDVVAHAVASAKSNPKLARDLVLSIDAEPMKRWFIDVGQNSGFWRAKFSGVKEKSYEPSSHLGKPNADELDALFERDNWRCRYCGIRVGGRGEHFKRFAKLINLPELAEGELNETRHGLRLMLQASYDHVQPKNQGGSNDQDNLVTACWSCQYGKGKFSLAVLKITESPLDKIWEPHGSWRGLIP